MCIHVNNSAQLSCTRAWPISFLFCVSVISFIPFSCSAPRWITAQRRLGRNSADRNLIGLDEKTTSDFVNTSFYKERVIEEDWCYQSQFTCDHQCNAPEKWNHANSNCGGKLQSPINVVTRKTLKDDRLTPFQFNNYQQIFRGTIKNNGHSVQVGVPHISTVSGGDLPTIYKAVQFHLHWGHNGGPGSEHTIDGEQYPMELHIVHMKHHYTDLTTALSDPEGVAVLGFFYERSNSGNRKYDPVINALGSITTANGNTSLSSISLTQLIPSEQNLTSYYRYKGSLTTPGCTEAVIWTLFETPIPLSIDQLRVFSELKFHDGKPMVGTFRPVQPLNGRQVFRSGNAVILASSALLIAAMATALGLSRPN